MRGTPARPGSGATSWGGYPIRRRGKVTPQGAVVGRLRVLGSSWAVLGCLGRRLGRPQRLRGGPGAVLPPPKARGT